jgi:uncharacterized repeat protein (TIGR01451 family)
MSKNYCTYLLKSFLVVIVFIHTQNTFAQNAKVTIDKKEILIGEQIIYTIDVEHPSPTDVINFSIPDSIPNFEIIDKSKTETTSSEGKNIWQQKIVLTSFDSGTWLFPALIYNVNNVKNYADSFSVNVGYMPIDSTAAPRDIKTVMEVSYFNPLWLIGGGLLLLGILISYLVYRYINKKKVNLTGTKKINAYKDAMSALAKLQKANETGAMPVKEYHTKLADVFKDYCGKIAFQNFFNFTTTEVLAKLKTYEINVQTSSEATEALQTGDATKFAKYNPSFAENEAALNFIKNTITEIEQSRSKTT